MARLDRLIPIKEVAQIGAAIGREFSYALLAAVSPMREDELQAALQRIVGSELVFQRGQPPHALYTFKHALVQDAAYDSLLKKRRLELHQRIAEALERHFPETVETQPELIAQHYTRAECVEAAIPYWLKAGTRALRASALEESVDHLSRGLKLMLTLPDSVARDNQEVDFQAAIGTALMMWKGYANPETGRAYQRADALLSRVGDSSQQFPVLWGIWAYYLVQPNYEQTLAAAQRALAVAEHSGDAGLMVQALSINCVTHFWMGHYLRAKAFTEKVLDIYDEAKYGSQVWIYNHDAKNLCLIYAAHYLWMLGYPDQAAQIDRERAAQARRLGHPFLMAFGDMWGGSVWHYRHDEAHHSQLLADLVTVSKEQGYPMWEAGGYLYQGWWLVQRGHVEEGTSLIKRAVEQWQATGAGNVGPYQRALLADAYSRGGEHDLALNLIDEAIAHIEVVNERCHEAEVHRLKGDILLRSSHNQSGAESAYRRSLDVARAQHARGWELRTATSYACLLQQQDRPREARALLQPIYDWFTEGFDTKDLSDAKAVLSDVTARQ
jgi:predicted ATPase